MLHGKCEGDWMKRCLLFCLCILFIIGLSGCGLWTEEVSEERVGKDTITIGLGADVLGFAPWWINWEMTTEFINFNIFNSLVTEKENRIVPSLAERWRNPTPDTWRFDLKKNVRFSNGDILTAEDVKFSLDYILRNDENPYKNLLAPVERVKVVDAYTVDIITKNPYPSLLTNLYEIHIISKKHVEGVEAMGFEKWAVNKRWPMGTGAYTLKEYVKDDHFVFERFDGYWGGKPEIKTATFKVYPDAKKLAGALLTGEIDIALQIPMESYEDVRDKDKINLHYVDASKVVYIAFDFREYGSYGFGDQKNPTSDVRVRKAIYHAIDINKIIDEVLHGLAKPATQFATPYIFGYNPHIKRLPYDLKEARRLMKETGYEDGFEIEMDCITDLDVNYPNYCKHVAKQLKDINITINLNMQPKKDYFPKVTARKTAMLLLGWGYDTGDAQELFDYILFSVDEEKNRGYYNLGYYSNPKVDELGERSAKLMDPADRLEVMQEGFRIAMDDVVWVPLTIPNILSGSSSDLDFEITTQGKIVLEDIRFK